MEIMGRELEVGFATEAVRGSAESTVDKWFKKVACNIVEKADHAQDDATKGVLEDQEGRRVTQKYVEGNIEGIAHVDALGYLFASLYGKVVTTTVSGSVKDHVFTLRQNIEHQSLTVFVKDGGVQQLKIAGAMVNTLELSATIDDYIRFVANIVGKTAADDTNSPSYDTEYDFIGRDIVVKVADSEAGLAAATPIKAKSISVKHDQGLVRDHVFGSLNPDDIYNAKHSIDGELVLNFGEETYKDLFLSDSAKYMSIIITGEADLGGTKYPTITYIFNKIMFDDWNRSGGNDELVTQSLKFKAYYNEADGEASQVTLRNLTSSYANVPSN